MYHNGVGGCLPSLLYHPRFRIRGAFISTPLLLSQCTNPAVPLLNDVS